ncbi:MAG: helix-turn-helix transcriptional regulator [Elusimicrobia bacterium]|nr:helix-turn-helix transcriptional regulator [Elusimicrobiota bacterium]
MKKDIYALVGKQLRAKRLEARLTIEELAETADISTSFLAYLETNKKKPSLATISKLADALKIPMSELFNESGAIKIPDAKQKALDKISKILHSQSQSNIPIIIATISSLSKSLNRK